MKNLFEPACVEDVKARVMLLQPDTQHLWGKMSAAQTVEHCARSLEWAVGDTKPPRLLIGRLIGGFVKPLALKEENPMRRNSPTAPDLIVQGEPEIPAGRAKLCGLIDRFAAGGAAQCTTHPHAFFGKMTPEEWAGLMYKHLDHHLRQFGV